MRQFTILITLLFQLSFAFGQIANDDLSFFDYSYNKSLIKMNKVKAVTVKTLFPKDADQNTTTLYFDKNGLLTKESTINPDGKTIQEFYFLTNSHNDLICRIGNYYETKKTDTVRYFKSYSNNKLIKDSSSQLPIAYNYEYDLNGKLFKTVIISNFGLGNYRKRITINKFNRLNRIVNSVETVFQNEKDSVGIIFSDLDYFYNKNGKIEREVEKVNTKYSWMANKGSTNYSYDSKGNLTQVIRKNTASYYYTYNHKGLIIGKRMKMNLDSDDVVDKATQFEAFYKFIYTFY